MRITSPVVGISFEFNFHSVQRVVVGPESFVGDGVCVARTIYLIDERGEELPLNCFGRRAIPVRLMTDDEEEDEV